MPSRTKLHAAPLGLALALAFALAFEAGQGCLLELPEGISCGDGWVDERFEACDPRVAESYRGKCSDGGDPELTYDGICRPEDCTLDCSGYCGDGFANGDEFCDGSSFRLKPCDKTLCTADCKLDTSECPLACGNGILTADEECDRPPDCLVDAHCPEGYSCDLFSHRCALNDGGGEVSTPKSCAGRPSNASGTEVENKTYTSGTLGDCLVDGLCVYNRSKCGFCGDGILDQAYTEFWVPGGSLQQPGEVCDGDEADEDELADHCRDLCGGGKVFDLKTACDFECKDDCSGFDNGFSPGPNPEDINCCLVAGTICPPWNADIPEIPCCDWDDAKKVAPYNYEANCVFTSMGLDAKVCPGP
ncbi:MAG: hypothetical protein KC431_28485 [Myxococcales bacterium]|nr:hypothetical protein [Myxococcales bacterium]